MEKFHKIMDLFSENPDVNSVDLNDDDMTTLFMSLEWNISGLILKKAWTFLQR